jgi:uncharacterized protein YecT (DUF1311 family)
MKKIFIFSSILFVFFTSSAWANLDTVNPAQLCPQLYTDNLNEHGSEENCKIVWNYYEKNNNYCGLALMSFNGQGGQQKNIQNAKMYANKLPKSEPQTFEDVLNSGMEVGCNKAKVLYNIQDENGVLTYENIANNVVGWDDEVEENNGHNETIQNYLNYFQGEVLKTLHVLAPLNKKLNKEQAAAFQILWDEYKNFLDRVGDAVPSTCESGNPDNMDGIIQDSEMLLQDFQENIVEVITTSQPLQKITHAEFIAADKQLNVQYKKLKKYPNSSDLKAFELVWIQYRDSYLHFAELYYSNKNMPEEIKISVLTTLTKEQANLLKGWVEDIKDSEKECGE